jgi:mevalonate kinase
MNKKTYPAKVLLLGEHIVLHGADALAAPLPLFGGHWAFSEADAKAGQKELPAWADYLHTHQQEIGLDTAAFQRDLNVGLYFESNIPTGYGLGSSGALCAAVYDRYAGSKISPDDTARLPELRRILARMESFFHGASSGTDPLICYLNRPVLLRPGDHIEPVALPSLERSGLHLFLLDSGQSRRTGPLVEYFGERCGEPAFESNMQAQFLRESDAAISAWLEGRFDDFRRSFTAVSVFQMEQLTQMIPDALHRPWRDGLTAGSFALKLCGAGGGGFFLGLTEDIEVAQSALRNWEVIALAL